MDVINHTNINLATSYLRVLSTHLILRDMRNLKRDIIDKFQILC